VAGEPPQHTGVPYAAAKAALNVYSKGLANAVAPSGVRVLAVMPSFIETDSLSVALQPMADRMGITIEALRANLREQFSGPLGRPGRGEEAAEVIAFLASSRASYLTGTQIALDGGLHPTM
jgi:NAD(P)-dependent dehydrogenase (short-subunit alcohol dehydrogenase family)